MKILIVEDEPDLRTAIVSFLEEEGSRCEQANTLDLASEKLNIYAYDCMLVDIGLHNITLILDTEIITKK